MQGRLKHSEKIRWNLKFAIIRQCDTEVDFAKILGISRSQLTHIVVGRYPGWPYREKIAKLLGHSEDWLFKTGGDTTIHDESYYKCGGYTTNIIIRWYRQFLARITRFFVLKIRAKS